MKKASVLLVLVAACGGFNPMSDSAQSGTDSPPTTEAEPIPTTTEALVDVASLPDLGKPQPLAQLDGWLQSEVDTLDDLKGKVVVVQFWTFGCINCKNTLENMRALYDRHRGEDFEIVGVHSPEFDYEKEPEAISAAAADLGVTWPIALDTTKFNFFNWQGNTGYWPRTFVIDQEGTIRYDHIGEGKYNELNATVAALLG